MNVNVGKVIKVVGKFAMPVVTGIMAFATEMDNQTLRNTVKGLTKRVTELESKIK